MKYIKLLIIGLITILSITLISGCGLQTGDEFIGTWKSKNAKLTDTSYYVIEKSDKDYTVTYYWMGEASNGSNRFKDTEKKQETAKSINQTLQGSRHKFIISNNILIDQNNKTEYIKESDKPMSFNELNTNGYPDPK